MRNYPCNGAPKATSLLTTTDNHLTKDKNGMLHSMFEKAGRAPFAINLPTDSAEEPYFLHHHRDSSPKDQKLPGQ